MLAAGGPTGARAGGRKSGTETGPVLAEGERVHTKPWASLPQTGPDSLAMIMFTWYAALCLRVWMKVRESCRYCLSTVYVNSELKVFSFKCFLKIQTSV
jgi:hypothetical protein